MLIRSIHINQNQVTILGPQDNTQVHLYTHKQLTLKSIIQIHELDIKLISGVHLWWFSNFTKFDFEKLSFNHSQDKSHLCLGLDQVWCVGPSSFFHHITYYTLL